MDLAELAYYSFIAGELAGVPRIISRTGYTGELGFELYFRGEEPIAERVWNAIMESGAPHGIEPAGLGARDTLRLEKGYCLYGNDIDETTSPLEAGLDGSQSSRKVSSSDVQRCSNKRSAVLSANSLGSSLKASDSSHGMGTRLSRMDA